MHHIIASGCTFSKQEEAQSSTGWTLTPEATRWDINAPVGGFPGECFFPSQGLLLLIINGTDVMTFPCNNHLPKPSLMEPFSECLRDRGSVHGQWQLRASSPCTQKGRCERCHHA